MNSAVARSAGVYAAGALVCLPFIVSAGSKQVRITELELRGLRLEVGG
jgi:hypothetical protein